MVALNCDYITKNPGDVEALVKGLYKANEFIKENPAKAYEVMAKGVGGWLKDPKDFASSAAGVNFYGKDRNAQFFAGGEGGEAGKLIKLGGDIWGGFGLYALLGGLVVWLVATWAHTPVTGRAAGIWHWL